MSANKSISVALASHNGERFIAEQIDSIISQLDESDELVISDDGSTDSTLDIVNTYASNDERIKLIASDREGVVSNFNNAISACTKDYVFISDQDDIWLENKRKNVLNNFEETDADLVIHNGCHINEEGTVVSDSFFDIWNIRPGLAHNFLKSRYSGCCMALKRSALSFVMPLPQPIDNYDRWIGVVCEAFGNVSFLNDVLLHHRLHDNNVTTSRRNISTISREKFQLVKALVQRRSCASHSRAREGKCEKS